MKNYVKKGEHLSLTAPYALSAGDGALVGSIFAVAITGAANAAAFEGKTCGVFDLTALSTDTAAQGADAYWDDTNKRITATQGSNTLVGAFAAAKANGDATARVWLKP